MIPLPVNQLAQEGWRVQVHNDKRTFTALSSNIKLRKLDTLKISHGTSTLGVLSLVCTNPCCIHTTKGSANVSMIIYQMTWANWAVYSGKGNAKA